LAGWPCQGCLLLPLLLLLPEIHRGQGWSGCSQQQCQETPLALLDGIRHPAAHAVPCLAAVPTHAVRLLLLLLLLSV
jgi:hypothetical protein